MVMKDDQFKEFLSKTQFLVEATDCERSFLRQKFSDNSSRINLYSWEQITPGRTEVVGHLDNRPVCLCMIWSKINDVLVMFYDCVSQVADHQMIEEWFAMHCSPMHGNRMARTNADNFHQVLNYVKNTLQR